MAIRPRLVTAKPKPVTSPYYVFDSKLEKLGGASVRDEGGERIVLLTEADAQYWLDQGVIGTKPFAELPFATQQALRQMNGGRL